MRARPRSASGTSTRCHPLVAGIPTGLASSAMPPREPPITEVSDPETVTPTKLDLPKGAARKAEKDEIAKAATEAGDEDDEDDQIAREDSMTRHDRDK